MEDKKIDLVTSEKIVKKKTIGSGVIEDKNVYATYTHICKACGYNKAQILDLGVWYGDEDNVFRLRCGKCGHTEQVDAKIT